MTTLLSSGTLPDGTTMTDSLMRIVILAGVFGSIYA